MCFVHFLNRSNFDVLEDSIDKKLEQFDSGVTTIEKMCSSNGVKIGDSRSDLTKEFLCLNFTNITTPRVFQEFSKLYQEYFKGISRLFQFLFKSV